MDSETNQQVATRINDEARRDPRSRFAGKYLGIANGQVAAVADNLNALVEQLRDRNVDLSQVFCLEVGLDYRTPQEVWRI